MPRRNIRIVIVMLIVCMLCAVHASRRMRVIQYAMHLISDRGLEPVDQQTLFEGAMLGMAAQADDYSDYIPADVSQKYNEVIDGKFGGVGVSIETDPDTRQLRIICPSKDSPASRAGILAGDIVLRIDGKSTRGMSLEDSSNLMRGKPGDPIVLTVSRTGIKEPFDIEVVRDVIHPDTVLGFKRYCDGSWDYMIDPEHKIAYLWIDAFTEQTDIEFYDVISNLERGGVRGVIIDLRNNSGGLLDRTIEICNLFTKPGDVIVSTRDRDGNVIDCFCASSGEKIDIPMVVLVDNNTASAAEILSACLQDYGLATVIGCRSFGKGTVQELYDLEPDLGILKLTVAGFWRPSEKNIHRHRDDRPEDDWGVMPDEGYVFDLTEKQRGALLLARFERTRPVLPGAACDEPGADAETSSAGSETNSATQGSLPINPEIDPELAAAIRLLRGEEKTE